LRTGAIIQARTSSSRLPRKVLRDLPYGSGITVLAQVIRRVKRAGRLDGVVVATTEEPGDDEIAGIAVKEGVHHFRGSTRDVLRRFYEAAKAYELDVIVRITGDCPCIDPELMDAMIERHLFTRADYTANTLVRTFPHGLDMEVLNFDVLEQSFKEAQETDEREHVTPFVYRSNPHLFRIEVFESAGDGDGADIRITLDTEEDYALLCAVFDYLYERNEFFGLKEILDLFARKPWLKLINSRVVQKKRFGSLSEEIREALRVLELQELDRARKVLEDSYEDLHID